jgi:sRNA-binding protein
MPRPPGQAAPLAPGIPDAPAARLAADELPAPETALPATDAARAATPDDPPAVVAPTDAATAPPALSPAECAARLAEQFPALFGGPPLPIKLRIQADIQQRAPGIFTRRVLSFFLSRHTTTTPYLKALVAQAQRYDLDGQAAGEISAEHRQAAIDELARRRQIVEARRAAERAHRAPRQPPAPVAEHLPGRDARPPRPPAGHGAPPHAGPARRNPAREMRTDKRARPAAQALPSGAARHRAGLAPQGSATQNAAQREWTPTDPAQRERALLLRAWESSSLTKANFCALKRLTEAQFDAQLELARQERSAARSA